MIIIIILIITYIANFTKFKKNKYEEYNYIGLYIYKLCYKFLGFKQYVSFCDINKYRKLNHTFNNNEIKRILLISNHVNNSDFINIQRFISDYYTEYIPLYIISGEIKKIPIYGKILENILLKYDKKKIQNRCKNLYISSITDNKKYIIVIFPEIYINADNINKYNEYGKTNNKLFSNLLIPQQEVVSLIMENFVQDTTLLTTLVYSDDLNNTKSKYIFDIIVTNISKCCHIYVCDISKILENYNIYYIWKKQDNLINDIYKYEIYKKYIHNNYINYSPYILLLFSILYVYFHNIIICVLNNK